MKEKFLWIAVIALAALCAGEAWYIHAGRGRQAPAAAARALTEARRDSEAKAFASAAEDMEAWRNKVHERLMKGTAPAPEDFDRFFDDEFFGRRFSPFAEMERIHRQMTEAFKDSERVMFDDSWDKWFAERMDMDQFETSVERSDKEVVVTVKVPGIDKAKADISVNNDRIKMAFTSRRENEEKTAAGVAKSEAVRSYVKILPVPADAVPGSSKSVVEGDKVKIVFARKAVSKAAANKATVKKVEVSTDTVSK
jgi:HSP20 family molecular chaperone IbpA